MSAWQDMAVVTAYMYNHTPELSSLTIYVLVYMIEKQSFVKPTTMVAYIVEMKSLASAQGISSIMSSPLKAFIQLL